MAAPAAVVAREHVFAVVTGASRGFGSALAVAFAAAARARGSALTVLLMSRDVEGLARTAEAVTGACSHAAVVTQPADMSGDALPGLEASWEAGVIAAAAAGRWHADGGSGAGQAPTRAVLLNNAGSLGAIAPLAELPSAAAVRAAIDANVTSCIWLTTLWLRWLRSSPSVRHASAINISSLAAVKPFPTQSLYCIGKAARDMLHAMIAAEASSFAATAASGSAGGGVTLKALNYAPGPLDTAMQGELRDSETLDAGTRAFFVEMKREVRGGARSGGASDDSAARAGSFIPASVIVLVVVVRRASWWTRPPLRACVHGCTGRTTTHLAHTSTTTTSRTGSAGACERFAVAGEATPLTVRRRDARSHEASSGERCKQRLRNAAFHRASNCMTAASRRERTRQRAFACGAARRAKRALAASRHARLVVLGL